MEKKIILPPTLAISQVYLSHRKRCCRQSARLYAGPQHCREKGLQVCGGVASPIVQGSCTDLTPGTLDPVGVQGRWLDYTIQKPRQMKGPSAHPHKKRWYHREGRSSGKLLGEGRVWWGKTPFGSVVGNAPSAAVGFGLRLAQCQSRGGSLETRHT